MLIVRNNSICCYADVGYSEFQLHSNLHVAYASVRNRGYLILLQIRFQISYFTCAHGTCTSSVHNIESQTQLKIAVQGSGLTVNIEQEWRRVARVGVHFVVSLVPRLGGAWE